MSVMEPREKWTDERLDDLSKKVDDGFARIDSDIRELRVEVKHQGSSLRAEMSAGFQRAERNLEGTKGGLEKKIDGTKADLEKKIDGTKADLERKIDGTKADLEKKIDGTKADLERTIEGTKGDLEKKIDGTNVGLEKKIDGTKAHLDDHTARVDKDIRELRSDLNRTIYGAAATIIVAQLVNSALF
jgi:F0F1-type ATP synthase membrane subunit b/b'